jgi:hypothetical protein
MGRSPSAEGSTRTSGRRPDCSGVMVDEWREAEIKIPRQHAQPGLQPRSLHRPRDTRLPSSGHNDGSTGQKGGKSIRGVRVISNKLEPPRQRPKDKPLTPDQPGDSTGKAAATPKRSFTARVPVNAEGEHKASSNPRITRSKSVGHGARQGKTSHVHWQSPPELSERALPPRASSSNRTQTGKEEERDTCPSCGATATKGPGRGEANWVTSPRPDKPGAAHNSTRTCEHSHTHHTYHTHHHHYWLWPGSTGPWRDANATQPASRPVRRLPQQPSGPEIAGRRRQHWHRDDNHRRAGRDPIPPQHGKERLDETGAPPADTDGTCSIKSARDTARVVSDAQDPWNVPIKQCSSDKNAQRRRPQRQGVPNGTAVTPVRTQTKVVGQQPGGRCGAGRGAGGHGEVAGHGHRHSGKQSTT